MPMNRSTLLVLALLVIALIAGVAFQRAGRSSPRDVGIVEGEGRVHADRVVVSASVPGTLIAFAVAEGEYVAGKQVVARLQDPRTAASLEEATRTLDALELELRSEQAALAVEQSQVPLAIRAAESTADLATTVLQQCQAVVQRLRAEIDALHGVEEPDEQTRLRLQDAELAHEQAMQDVLNAHAAADRAEEALSGVRVAREGLVAHIRKVEELIAERDSAAAAARVAGIGERDLEVLAPAQGVVVSRRANIGDVLAIGEPVLELVDPADVYVVVDLAESHRAAIRPGEVARVYLETAPGGFVDATVTAVLDAPGGGFTAKLTFNAAMAAPPTLGLRCRVAIRTREDAKWP